MGGPRVNPTGPTGRELEQAYRIKQGHHSGKVAQLMGDKQDAMVEWGWVKPEQLRHINKWHLMSAELVIADLLRKLEELNPSAKL